MARKDHKNRDWDKELTVLKNFLPTEGLVWEWSCRTGHLGALLGADFQWQGGETNPDYFQLAQQKHRSKVHQRIFHLVGSLACIHGFHLYFQLPQRPKSVFEQGD